MFVKLFQPYFLCSLFSVQEGIQPADKKCRLVRR